MEDDPYIPGKTHDWVQHGIMSWPITPNRWFWVCSNCCRMTYERP